MDQLEPQEKAECRSAPPNVIFVGDNPRGTRGDYADALTYCERCTVKKWCLDQWQGADTGVWGGKVAGELRKSRRPRARALSRDCGHCGQMTQKRRQRCRSRSCCSKLICAYCARESGQINGTP